MSTVVVLATPPRAGLVCEELPDSTPLSAAEAAELYEAALKDTLRAAEQAGGDLLVNYRPAETIPDEYHTDTEPEAEVRALASEALEDVTAVRFEKQVGSSVAARVGNTVTHLLETEEEDSVTILRGTAPLVRRSTIDSGTMKLRSNQTVLGPSTNGRVYYAGFTKPIEFEEAFTHPAVETLTERARDVDHEVEYIPMLPRIDTATGLKSLLPLLRARIRAERVVPTNTATFVHEQGLRVRDGETVREE
jgi:glycosyltransferase A (GT-A) superfamily protein (DUF2064 family)